MHRSVRWPWDMCEVLHCGDGTNAGRRLSLQSHRHRSVHWIVVRSMARVTHGDEAIDIAPNRLTYILPGTGHRLENKARTIRCPRPSRSMTLIS